MKKKEKMQNIAKHCKTFTGISKQIVNRCNLININPFILQSLPYSNIIQNSYTMLKKI